MNRDRYELIDFGEGRKLESLAGRLIDRPSPAAAGVPRRQADLWHRVESRFDTHAGRWSHATPWPESMVIDCGPFRMPLRPTPFGHIGLFPEQSDNWQWLARPPAIDRAEPEGLNLFAYTGASTLAMASAGLAVAHVDAAKPNVTAARAAAKINGLGDHPIRYLVDDARKFVAREVRRQRLYHTIVLDPPSYGHGATGKAWRMQRDLWPLLDDCLKLLTPGSFRLLVTGHSADLGHPEVLDHLRRSTVVGEEVRRSAMRIEAGRSKLTDRAGRMLDAGFFVRIEK